MYKRGIICVYFIRRRINLAHVNGSRVETTRFGGHVSQRQRSWSYIQHVHSAYLPIWVRLLGSLEDRCTEDRCFWSVMSTNAARYQMAPICSKRRGPEANGTTQTHCNSPVTLPDHFWGTLCIWMIRQVPRRSCQLSLQRTGGDLEDAPASHGWAPYSRIWDPTISHCLKQWIWPRTGLCGGCVRRMMLRNLELHARNDDNEGW